MKQRYRTKAREAWANFLRYDEKDQTYKYYIDFMYGNWGEPNRVALVFDKHGEYVETKPFVYYKFRNKTMDETAEDHILFAMNYKETAEKIIKALIKPIKKENIVFHLESTWVDETELEIRFDIDEMSYCYDVNWENPYRNQFVSTLREDSDSYFIQVHEIPSLKGLRHYVRNHPKIRVKFVNELARYEQAKKKIEKEHKTNLDDR
jgi:hypothetical protein